MRSFRQKTLSFRARLQLVRLIMFCFLALGFAPMAQARTGLPESAWFFLEALQKQMQLAPTVGEVRPTAKGIALRNVVFKPAGNAATALVGVRSRSILLQGEGRANGLIRFERVVIEGGELLFRHPRAGLLRMRIPRLEMRGVSILPPDAARTPQEKLVANRLLAELVQAPEILLAFPNGAALPWRGFRQRWQGNRRTGEGTAETVLGSLALTARQIAGNDGDLLQQLQALGLERMRLAGVMRSRSRWGGDQRLHVISLLHLQLENAGSLELLLEDLSVPLPLFDALEKLRDSAASETDAASARSRQLLNNPEVAMALRLLTVQRIRLTWRDAGLARRYLARQAIGEAAAIAATIARIMSALRPLGHGPIGMKVQTALERFLRNPQNLRIDIRGRGGAPINIPMLSALALAPQMLSNALQIDIRANVPEK